MKTGLLALSAIAALAASTASAATKDKNWKHKDGEMPERWSLVSKDYALCDAGLAQSPIDLGQPNARGNIEVLRNYGNAAGTMALGEAKVQVDFAPGQGMGLNTGNTFFKLLQVHFHTPSEHAINGKRAPLAGHLVHATESGNLAVLGVLFVEGAPNPALAKILAAKAKGNGTPIKFDVNELLPKKQGLYRYMGSLTTPPCSEGVNWHVASTPVTASAEQIASFRAAMGDSARSLQPFGNRLLVQPVRSVGLP